MAPSAAPTLNPSQSPILPGTPTFAPTAAVVTVLAGTQSISGVTLQQANFLSDGVNIFKESFKTILGNSLSGGVKPSDINIIEITAFSLRRVLLQSGVLVAYNVTVINTDAAVLNTNLNTAISDGTFTAALVSEGYPAAASGTPVTLINVTPTVSPSSIPSQSPTVVSQQTNKNAAALSAGGIAGVVIGGFVFLCLVAIGIYFLLRRKVRPSYTISGLP
jgi:hypothetical protein